MSTMNDVIQGLASMKMSSDEEKFDKEKAMSSLSMTTSSSSSPMTTMNGLLQGLASLKMSSDTEKFNKEKAMSSQSMTMSPSTDHDLLSVVNMMKYLNLKGQEDRPRVVSTSSAKKYLNLKGQEDRPRVVSSSSAKRKIARSSNSYGLMVSALKKKKSRSGFKKKLVPRPTPGNVGWEARLVLLFLRFEVGSSGMSTMNDVIQGLASMKMSSDEEKFDKEKAMSFQTMTMSSSSSPMTTMNGLLQGLASLKMSSDTEKFNKEKAMSSQSMTMSPSTDHDLLSVVNMMKWGKIVPVVSSSVLKSILT
ncbi:hypothetical protein NE237_022737 [Protea cynaroides]|uniref:Uncharacterized protein n=1 Tax=Protea cynaroides TaxID=273540 RepID=A0A9Q0HDM8_9MAGN|nr:hypothetical protein NE237_022737 [Protea cynaroides]